MDATKSGDASTLDKNVLGSPAPEDRVQPNSSTEKSSPAAEVLYPSTVSMSLESENELLRGRVSMLEAQVMCNYLLMITYSRYCVGSGIDGGIGWSGTALALIAHQCVLTQHLEH